MKNLIALMLLSLALVGCAESKSINNKVIPPYGLFNEQAEKVPGVVYEISAPNIIVAIIFCETIVVPVYIFGWNMYQPVR